MRAIIMRFEGIYAICMKEDNSIVDIKRINIPRDARAGDMINIDNSSIILEKQIAKEKYTHNNDIIIDQW